MGTLAAAHHLLPAQMGNIIFFSPVQIGGFIVFCIVLGLLGSWAAMHKYLKLQVN